MDIRAFREEIRLGRELLLGKKLESVMPEKKSSLKPVMHELKSNLKSAIFEQKSEPGPAMPESKSDLELDLESLWARARGTSRRRP